MCDTNVKKKWLQRLRYDENKQGYLFDAGLKFLIIGLTDARYYKINERRGQKYLTR